MQFKVVGTPAPQGSKRAFTNKKTGRARVVEASSKVKPWRADVRAAAEAAIEGDPGELWEAPVSVSLKFYMPRPKSHYGSGRNAGVVKESAPLFPASIPDVDKLARAVLDALTGVVFADDKTVVRLSASKLYATSRPGLSVTASVLKLYSGRPSRLGRAT